MPTNAERTKDEGCCVCDCTVKLSTMNVCPKHEQEIAMLVRELGMTPSVALNEVLVTEWGG